jgi:hypothetical protein
MTFIELSGLFRRYGDHTAGSDIARSEGPGKTTTVECVEKRRSSSAGLRESGLSL